MHQHLEDGHLPESQYGFRKGRGTADMVLATRQPRDRGATLGLGGRGHISDSILGGTQDTFSY